MFFLIFISDITHSHCYLSYFKNINKIYSNMYGYYKNCVAYKNINICIWNINDVFKTKQALKIITAML